MVALITGVSYSMPDFPADYTEIPVHIYAVRQDDSRSNIGFYLFDATRIHHFECSVARMCDALAEMVRGTASAGDAARILESGVAVPLCPCD